MFPSKTNETDTIRPAILSTANFGGAGTAALRLHTGLSCIGCDSTMLAGHIRGISPSTITPTKKRMKLQQKLGSYLDPLPTLLYSRREKALAFSPAWYPSIIHKLLKGSKSDVVNIHWVNEGFCSVESIGVIPDPVVWTLHDMWAFTGGCHYAGDCSGFETGCGKCPQLRSNRRNDLSRLIVLRKKRSWGSRTYDIVTPSRWLADCARRSTLLRNHRISVVTPGIDLTRYRPIDKTVARSLLGLEQDKAWILFGAWGNGEDPRKGFDLLQEALAHLADDTSWRRSAAILTFGAGYTEWQKQPSFPVRSLGEVSDELSLVLAYNAADVFVAPSRQDNAPNTIVESMACGTPCVAFRIGGIPDLINHQISGYLAQPFSTEDLAVGIAWTLSSVEQRARLRQNARQMAEEKFDLIRHAREYLSLFAKAKNAARYPA
jgi:glycosyltransferase involved in cell wall biosynthesis